MARVLDLVFLSTRRPSGSWLDADAATPQGIVAQHASHDDCRQPCRAAGPDRGVIASPTRKPRHHHSNGGGGWGGRGRNDEGVGGCPEPQGCPRECWVDLSPARGDRPGRTWGDDVTARGRTPIAPMEQRRSTWSRL